MKFLTALLLCLPLSSFAANYAACDLYAFYYDSDNNLTYKPSSVKKISSTWEHLRKSQIYLEDSVYPISYKVEFNAEGFISGSLSIKIDQPGPTDAAIVSLDNYLKLEVEDVFNGGKVIYKLDCGLDS